MPVREQEKFSGKTMIASCSYIEKTFRGPSVGTTGVAATEATSKKQNRKTTKAPTFNIAKCSAEPLLISSANKVALTY